MLATNTATQIDLAVARLEAWLETMRGSGGYGGPVAHWWRQSLSYTGPGFDWRYEGIIVGYLQLWERTNQACWLMKAQRAGDDLLAAQLDNGHFTASSFEANPAAGGTPHEAACDAGLLRLALTLRAAGYNDWQKYADCANRNLQNFYIHQLWDTENHSFRDSPSVPSFVPNKVATACEAFFLLAEIRGEERWVETYVLPNLARIIEHQRQEASDPLLGAIAQNSFGRQKIEKYFPIYNARCIPALLLGYEWTKEEKYLEAAWQVMRFIERWVNSDGALPTVIYSNQKVNRYPAWIAPLGDILRANTALERYGLVFEFNAIQKRLLTGQDNSGGIQTAWGFAEQVHQRTPTRPDVRDLLHVVGWCDKAFRHLTSQVSGLTLPKAENKVFEAECIFRGQALIFSEQVDQLEVTNQAGQCRYRWRKGQPWAEIAAPEFWLH
jgi:hypothetical protein